MRLEPEQCGRIARTDLAVPDAERLRDSHTPVVGWRPDPADMGGNAHGITHPPGAARVATVCHARGPNVGLPPL